MILSALLLAAVQPAAIAVEDEIVVIGRRLNSISTMVGKDQIGRFTCSVDKSSGNVNLDKRLCKTTVRCIRDGAVGDGAVKACVEAEKPKLLAKLRRELEGSR
ncbi:hypothetical protein [Sphingorhabdus sp. EL138]|uniref:hypothetical protein n=1 Tax=Sphingorhabdus sp. EL138 TaxID=2073156 RepID=UPI000D69830D|nr:hypothetical protein [Sphingorhabdus sp. EL138]